jgi:hypothetical protein
MEIPEIKRRVLCCIETFYANDNDLLNRENYEVTITSKLSQYLALHFPEYQVDCEYNKHIKEIKKVLIKNKLVIVRPDIVIHKREDDALNLVYIEVKTDHNSEDRDSDFDKIKAMTKQDKKYHYQLGVFIDFYRGRQDLECKFYINGEECEQNNGK